MWKIDNRINEIAIFQKLLLMDRYRYLANALTILRLSLFIPIIITLVYENLNVLWMLLFIGAISDILDGYFARKSKVKSAWGSKYDPFADKVILITPLIWMVAKNIIPFWSLALMFVRDLLVTEGRSSDSEGKPASFLAKIKTSILFISILLITIPCCYVNLSTLNYLTNLGLTLYWISLLISIITGLKYTFLK